MTSGSRAASSPLLERLQVGGRGVAVGEDCAHVHVVPLHSREVRPSTSAPFSLLNVESRRVAADELVQLAQLTRAPFVIATSRPPGARTRASSAIAASRSGTW